MIAANDVREALYAINERIRKDYKVYRGLGCELEKHGWHDVREGWWSNKEHSGAMFEKSVGYQGLRLTDHITIKGGYIVPIDEIPNDALGQIMEALGNVRHVMDEMDDEYLASLGVTD